MKRGHHPLLAGFSDVPGKGKDTGEAFRSKRRGQE